MEIPISERDTGLAAMVVAAQPGDHGVVADWIEEYLRLDDLAAVLRAGLDDPRRPDELALTSSLTYSAEFRFRRIDRFVLLSLATYRYAQPREAGAPRRPEPTGHVVCLCTPPRGVEGMRRFGRWFPATMTPPALTRLWDDLGEDMPHDAK